MFISSFRYRTSSKGCNRVDICSLCFRKALYGRLLVSLRVRKEPCVCVRTVKSDVSLTLRSPAIKKEDCLLQVVSLSLLGETQTHTTYVVRKIVTRAEEIKSGHGCEQQTMYFYLTMEKHTCTSTREVDIHMRAVRIHIQTRQVRKRFTL